VLLAAAHDARATGDPTPKITTNNYALEFFQGPLIAPSRIIGVGGAYTALAEGIDGAPVNAASPAVREPFSYDWFDWDFALDASLPGAYGGTDFDNYGPNNSLQLQETVNSFLYLHAGALVQMGALGVSATAEFFQYGISPRTGSGSGVTLVYGRYHALVGYGLLDDQVVIGAGARIVTLDVKSAQGSLTEGQTLLTLNGAGPEAGLVWKPNAYPFRVGTTFRSAVSATVAGFGNQVGGFLGESFGESGGNSAPSSAPTATGGGEICPPGRAVRAGLCHGFVLPATATVPWELETGFAVQLGPRPINPPWLDPHVMERPVHDRIDKMRAARRAQYARELAATPQAERGAKLRAQAANEEVLRGIEDQELDAESASLRSVRVARNNNWPRERITILGSLLVTGTSTNAVSLEGFANQELLTVGQSISLSPRIGIESEPIPNWLNARVGSYLEPSRFATGTARQHFTAGADIKLFPFSPWGIFGDRVWRLTIVADLAPRYQNYGIGLGAWH
jgi:hypothetical protein